MNYSDTELSTNRTNEETLVEAGVELLPRLGKALFAAITSLGHAHGLTPAQVKVLLQLGSHQQMTVGEIGAAVGCSLPAASELVDRLVDAGHLVRASDPADRRRVLVAATPDSQRISADLNQLRHAQIRHALDQLPVEHRPIFITSLEALVTGLQHPESTVLSPAHARHCQGTEDVNLKLTTPDPSSRSFTGDENTAPAKSLRGPAQ